MKTLSEWTLRSMTKAELIAQLRCAEHNYAAAQKTIEQQAKNFENFEPVRYGEWIDVGDFIKTEDGIELPVKVCSVCGAYIVLEDFQNFCPNCGAKNEIEKIKYFERTN